MSNFTKKEYNSLGYEILYTTEEELLNRKENKTFELEHRSDNMRNNLDVIYKLCEKNKHTYNLKYRSDNVKNHKKLIIRLLHLDSNCCKYISENLKSDEEVMLLSIKKEYLNIQYISNKLFNNQEFLNKAILINPSITEFIDSLKTSSNENNKKIGKELESVIQNPVMSIEEQVNFLHSEKEKEDISYGDVDEKIDYKEDVEKLRENILQKKRKKDFLGRK